jgi:hypothetical protein
MREFINIMEGYKRLPSPALLVWLQTWVESSYKIQDQIAQFEPLEEEASTYLNVAYPYIYRGMSITEDQLDTLNAEGSVTILAHRLQSWTKNKGIADDYALPGYGGDVGILVRKTGTRIKVVLDIQNVLRHAGRSSLGRDAAREKEVIVDTSGSLVLNKAEIIKVR